MTTTPQAPRSAGAGRRLRVPLPSLEASLPYIVAAVAPLVLASLVLELWKANFDAPFFYQRDALGNLMLIKETLHQSWPLHNPLLGAPFGQDLQDFPVVAGDPLHLLIVKFIGLFSSNPAVVLNVFFLLQFPIISVAALWVFRRLGVPTWPAVACAVIYSVAPYHFYRGELHVWLAGYWGVPLGLFLVLNLLMGRPLARPRGAPAGPGAPLSLGALAVLCVIVGMSEVYYSVMTLLLLGAALVLACLRPNWRELLRTGVLAAAIVAAVVAVDHAPTLVYHARHGANSEIAKSRDPAQSDTFGMKITRLVLPVEDHRIKPLANLTRTYVRDSPSQLDEEEPQALGLVGTVGFLALIVIGLVSVVPAPRRFAPEPLLRAAAAAAILAALIGASGGFSGVMSYLVSHSIRSWNRYSVFIAFVALLPLAAVLARLRAAMARRGLGGTAFGTVLSAVVLVALLDQTGSTLVPPYNELRTQWRMEAAFTHAIEARVPNKALIYEAPTYPFPEWGYELARGYLHSDRLRWSFGAMEGRPADWEHALLGQPGNVVIPSVAAAGFAGVYVDRRLYPDNGAAADADLTSALGPPVVVSADKRFAFYDMQPYAARLRAALGPAASGRLARMTLYPPRAEFGPQFGPDIPNHTVFAADNQRTADQPRGWIDLVNPSDHTMRVRLDAVFGADVSSAQLLLTLPGRAATIGIGRTGTPFNVVFDLPPGRSRVTATTNITALTARKTYLVIENFKLMDAAAYDLALKAASQIS